MNLLNACKMALEIVAGERIKNDAFPPKGKLLISHDKYVRECEEGLEQAIAEAECGISAEDRYGKDVKPEPKPLAQYLDEYIEHEIDLRNIDSDASACHALWQWSTWRELLEQVLDAYESTEGVRIKIEKQ